MRNELRAEWTKLRTLSSTYWLASATVASTVSVSALVAASVAFDPSTAQDPVKISLIGLDVGQAVVAILAVLAVSGEYSSGMIGGTLAAMPRRLTLLAAKATVVTAWVLVAGTLSVLGCLIAGWLLLPDNLSSQVLVFSSDGSTLRAAAGSAVYLVMIALLSLGIAVIVRDSAVAIGTVLSLLYLFPLITQVLGNEGWRRHIEQIGPMSAGHSIRSTVELQQLSIGPWGGLVVVAVWSVVAIVAGSLFLQKRDA